MSVDEMKNEVEAMLLQVGINLHPNGSGWFQSPNGNWLCSFMSQSADANLMAMMDPKDGSSVIFTCMGGLTLRKEPRTPAEQASVDELKEISGLLDTSIVMLLQRDREPTDNELTVIGRLYFKMIRNIRTDTPVEPKRQRHSLTFEQLEAVADEVEDM